MSPHPSAYIPLHLSEVTDPGSRADCVKDHLVTVTYLFGPRLPSHGKFIATRAEIEQFARRPEHFTGYLI